MSSRSRLLKEIKEAARDADPTIRLAPDGENLLRWSATLKGPEDTPFETGTFVVRFSLPESYPLAPPRAAFETKIFHPNVHWKTGEICLDILKEQWSPALSIKTAMLSLQALLSSPEPSDPQDAVVARQYMDNLAEFNAQAKRWTKEYAAAGAKDEKLERLKEMGFAENAVRAALGRAAGDEQQALELLLTGI